MNYNFYIVDTKIIYMITKTEKIYGSMNMDRMSITKKKIQLFFFYFPLTQLIQTMNILIIGPDINVL